MFADVSRFFLALLTTLAMSADLGFGGDGESAQTAGRDKLRAAYAAAEQRLKGGDGSAAVWIQILETLYRLDQPQKALGAARVRRLPRRGC
jgi:hypothetical protein